MKKIFLLLLGMVLLMGIITGAIATISSFDKEIKTIDRKPMCNKIATSNIQIPKECKLPETNFTIPKYVHLKIEENKDGIKRIRYG